MKKNSAVTVIAQSNHLRFVRRGTWEYVERKGISGIVGIVAVTPENKLLLVEQFRPPLNKCVVELPAGLAGDIPSARTEALATAAKRELLEETGYRARSMKYLAEGTSSAGLCDEVITLFRATGLTKVNAGGGDAHEKIVVHEIPLRQLRNWLTRKQRAGCQIDLKIFAGLYFVEGR
ncbi:MAG TPA: NUDIX hydrolase [Planctomycetota bacterium]|jgi:ADP-ribose pyrophosphatase